MIKGFIFDVDGVVINTENTHFLAYRDVFKEYNFNLTVEGYKTHFSGKSIKGGVLSLLKTRSFEGSTNEDNFIKEISHKKISRTVEHFKKQVIYFDDTLAFIKRIAEGNITLNGIGQVIDKPILAMATGLEAELITLVLNNHNLEDLFTIVVTPEQYTTSKPDPECYLTALEKMGLSANEVIGVEDSPSGITALNRANIFSVAVTNSFSNKDLKEAKLIVEALTDLI